MNDFSIKKNVANIYNFLLWNKHILLLFNKYPLIIHFSHPWTIPSTLHNYVQFSGSFRSFFQALHALQILPERQPTRYKEVL